MTQAERSAATRQRLLEAAADMFAEHGYRDATIQAICRRARANIAAVHYHFGDKDGLYSAVFDYAEHHARPDPTPSNAADTTAEDRLRENITSFLTRLLDSGRPAWTAKLMAREMIDPTPVLDRLVRRRWRATHERLGTIIRELLGPGASDETVRLCTISVVAQCAFFRNSAAVVTRIYPELAPTSEIPRIADHVTRFTLGAVAGLRPRPRRRA
ncbi:MAG TPA: CerR family C-terminal domain-containing protein [Candidatus Binatia bacterium]|jgi:AcrR family transcriptional regulator|nr:CerR family C-terminal domain-containing protein [Candidatus Binatia bacterium]